MYEQALSKIACNRLQKELVEWQVNPPCGFKHKVTDNLQRCFLFLLFFSLALFFLDFHFFECFCDHFVGLFLFLLLWIVLWNKDGWLKWMVHLGLCIRMRLISFKLIFLSITPWKLRRLELFLNFMSFFSFVYL